MKEKVIGGWILGKDGMWRVNPKWKNGEVMADIEKPAAPAVAQEVKKRADLVEEVRPSVKTKSCGSLGPRGLRRNGGNNYGGLSAANYSGDYPKVEVWAVAEKKMKQDGYGFFPKDFKPPSYAAKKPFHFVGQDYLTVTLDCYKLSCKLSFREKPKLCIFNPFSEGMPFGEKHPLPRYI